MSDISELRKNLVSLRVYTTVKDSDDGKHPLYHKDVDKLLSLIDQYSTKQPVITITDLRCPACNGKSLFVASGNYITCGFLECPNPDYADAVAKQVDAADTAGRIDELTHWANFFADPSMDAMTPSDRLNKRIAELTAKQSKEGL